MREFGRLELALWPCADSLVHDDDLNIFKGHDNFPPHFVLISEEKRKKKRKREVKTYIA